MSVDGLAHVPVTIDVTAQSQEQTDLQIKSICKQLLKEWANVQDKDILISRISGGLSNALYKVTPPPPLDSISFRIYGPGTEVFVHRDTELKLMQLLHSQAAIGPALHGTFNNGRLEEYLHMRCLEFDEIATSDTIIAQIAKKMAQLHSTLGADAVLGPSCQATRTPFAKTREWLAIAEKLDFTSKIGYNAEIAKTKADKLATFDFREMNRQVDLVEAVATKLNSPIVLAHCDLLAGNIMYNQPLASSHNDDNVNSIHAMTFIDFEYSGWAPRGFDLGNHFCEYAGFDCDYSRYPDEAAASKFLRTYLEETKALVMMGQHSTTDTNGVEVVTVGGGGGGGGEDEDDEEEVRAAVIEANVYALSAHMFWGAWAFLQAAWSDIDFDYLEYAGLRWGEYYKRRDEFLGAVEEKNKLALLF